MNTSTTQATPESIWAILQENARQQTKFAAEADERFRKYEEQQEKDAAEARVRWQEHEKSWQELKKFQAEVSRNIDKVSRDIANQGKNLGGLNNRIGEIMETLLAARMWEKFKDYNYDFERAYQRVGIYNGTARLTDVDILLSNGAYAMAVEVKNTLNRVADVDDHLDRMEKLMRYPPAEIKGKKVLGAMACGVFDADVRDYAFSNGLFVLELTGDTAHLATPPANFTPQEWAPR
ncbi:hypothetical protein FACS189456_7390 [Bacteroidia bacterium]|nr:hypothetical protein FACS189456_7390 [Bacteroidia bacterium]